MAGQGRRGRGPVFRRKRVRHHPVWADRAKVKTRLDLNEADGDHLRDADLCVAGVELGREQLEMGNQSRSAR